MGGIKRRTSNKTKSRVLRIFNTRPIIFVLSSLLPVNSIPPTEHGRTNIFLINLFLILIYFAEGFLNLYDEIHEHVPKKVFLARWYPSAAHDGDDEY